jgi:archaellin
MLTINLNSVNSGVPSLGLPTRTDVWGVIQPEDGASGVFAFTSPASYASTLVFNLY